MRLEKLKIIAICIFLFSAYSTVGQEFVQIDKNDFVTAKEGGKAAWKSIKNGNDYFLQDTKGTYKMALSEYLVANNYNPNSAKLNYLIGVCFLKTVEKSNAIKYFERAFAIDEFVTFDIKYWMGVGYQLTYEFEKAIDFYEKYRFALAPRELREWGTQIEKKIKECDNGIELLKKPTRVFIDNLGDGINTKYPEYSPVISADEEVLLFTSRRPETTGGKLDAFDLEYYEDIYFSFKSQGKWLKAENMGKPINTKQHDATVSMAPNGQSLFIFRSAKGGSIHECLLDGNHWLAPAPLPRQINSDLYETSACLTADGKSVYFVRKDPDNWETGEKGQKDIYVTSKNTLGLWSEGKKLSNTINTPYDEDGVFIHPDGRTLYFSSEGHYSMGGFDIFKSVRDENGNWSVPENLGHPINTPDDDLFFVISASGKTGYYSSVKPDGYGDSDIYKVTFLNPERSVISTEDNLLACLANPLSATSVEKAMDIKTVRLTIVKGTVYEALTSQPIEAEIEIIDNEKNEVVSSSSSNRSTGKYLVALPSGKNYGIVVRAEGYLFHSENFNIPAATEYQQISKDVELLSMEIGSKVVLKNIFFQTGKSELRNESKPELERIIKLVETYPNLKLEISGHTDNVGSAQVNQDLSTARAKAVVDYLVENGADKNRLIYRGYGFSQPIADNNMAEGRSQNRRVEFKIIEN